MTQDITQTVDKLVHEYKIISECNKSTVDECIVAASKLNYEDFCILMRSARDVRFGDNLLVAVDSLMNGFSG